MTPITTAPLPVQDLLGGQGYERFTKCVNAVTAPAGATFEILLDNGSTLPASVEIIAEKIIRFTVGAPGQRHVAPPVFTLPTLDATHAKVIVAGNCLVFQTPALTMRLNTQPFQLEIQDAEGRTLLRERTDDRHCYDFIWEEGEANTEHSHGYHAFPLGVCPSSAAKQRFLAAFPLAPDEAIYGFGEKFGRLNKAGSVVRVSNSLCSVGDEGANCSVPLWLSTHGYGCFVRTFSPMLFDIGANATGTLRFGVEEDCLDLYFIGGPEISDIVSTYTLLTGRPPVPPDWTFGMWWGRCTYWNQEQVESFAHRMREERIACDLIRLDNGWMAKRKYKSPLDFDFEWDSERFPDPDGMLRTLHKLDFKTCLWIAPKVLQGTVADQELRACGAFVEETGWPNSYFDFSDESTCQWFSGRLETLLKQGVDTFFLDVGMQAPNHVEWSDFERVAVRGAASYHYIRVAAQTLERFHGVPVAHWALAGHAGTQRFGARCGGDARSTDSDNAAALRGGLSAALCGFSLWGCDIGGFGSYPGPPPERDYFLRSLQYGVFLPLMFVHGVGPREPWSYDADFLNRFREICDFRIRLRPYLLSIAETAAQTGVPMMRPLVYDFQKDRNTWNIDDCFLLGDALLVIPLFDASGQRTFYLPEEDWVDFWTDEPVEGGKWHTVQTNPDRTPVYRRVGKFFPA